MPMQVITREEAVQAGERLYDERLKSELEPVHNGKIVAIHIPSSEYFVGQSLFEATDRLRQNHPQFGPGEVYARSVGNKAVIQLHTPRGIAM